MEKRELTREEMEKIVGGMHFAYATVPSEDIAIIINKAWDLKVVKRYTKEQAIEEICSKYRPVQRSEITDLISQYWDRLV